MDKESQTNESHLSRLDMKRVIRLMAVAAGLLLLVKFFSQVMTAIEVLFSVFTPFLLGGAIAFVLNVPMRGVEKLLFGNRWAAKKKGLQKVARPVSLLVTFLLLIVLIALFVLVLIPQLRETAAIISESAQRFFPKVERWLNETFADDPRLSEFFLELELDWKELASTVTSVVQNSISTVVTSGVNVVVSLVSGTVNFFIGLFFSCYVLVQKEKLGNQARRIAYAALPRRAADNVCGIASMAHATFSSFVRGQCLEAVILGLMFVVAMTIFGMPYALLVGVLVTFTALIPVFGAFIGCALSALMILMVDPFKALMFVILFLILQQIEGNLIYPHVVGSSVGLPSIWVLVAVTVGANLMGVMGMLLFIPLASVLYALLRSWVNKRNDKLKNEFAVQPKKPSAQS